MLNAGQNSLDYSAGPQPGNRPPARGRLGLVQAFVNSNYDLGEAYGTDLLADSRAALEWCVRRGLLPASAQVGEDDVSRMRAVRDGLRELLIANNGGPCDDAKLQHLNRAAGEAGFSARFGCDSVGLVPITGGVDGVLATVLAIVTEAVHTGEWRRLKACREHDCQWAFYDHSRNGGSRWCSMRVCGGRAKQRAYYARSHGRPPFAGSVDAPDGDG